MTGNVVWQVIPSTKYIFYQSTKLIIRIFFPADHRIIFPAYHRIMFPASLGSRLISYVVYWKTGQVRLIQYNKFNVPVHIALN